MDLLNIEKMTEKLEQKNVQENFELAVETAPESFGRVVKFFTCCYDFSQEKS